MFVAGGISEGTANPLAAANLASREPGPNTRPHPFTGSWIRSCSVGTSNSTKWVLWGGGWNAEALGGTSTWVAPVLLSGACTRPLSSIAYPGPLVRLPNGGTVGLRPSSTSGPPTIDVTVQGIGIREIKFLP